MLHTLIGQLNWGQNTYEIEFIKVHPSLYLVWFIQTKAPRHKVLQKENFSELCLVSFLIQTELNLCYVVLPNAPSSLPHSFVKCKFHHLSRQYNGLIFA